VSSYGKFNLEVKVTNGGDPKQRANEIMLLMREEVANPDNFMKDLNGICHNVAEFLQCELELEETGGILLARFIFEE
jgi:hypothetical protein